MSTLAKLKTVEDLLAQWLIDRTDKVFEEEPEIDSARALLLEVIDHLELTTQVNLQTVSS